MLGRDASLAWVRISRLSRVATRFLRRAMLRFGGPDVVSRLIRLNIGGLLAGRNSVLHRGPGGLELGSRARVEAFPPTL
jgi:hypothetical protein